MKRNLILLLIALLPVAAFSQDRNMDSARDPHAREKIRAAHAAYITQRLELTSEEAERFWPVYREYTEKRRELRREMKTGQASGTTDEALLKRDLDLKQQDLNLEKEYTEKFSQIITAEKLVKLRQAEADFRRLLLRQLQERRRHRR